MPRLILTDPWPDSIYVAGPMRGYELYNFPSFDRAASRLRYLGWDVYSPADHDRELGIDPTLPLDQQPESSRWEMKQAFRWDATTIVHCSAIFMLERWEESQGATIEHGIADMCGLRILYETEDQFVKP